MIKNNFVVFNIKIKDGKEEIYMPTISSKELMFLEDNIKMMQNSVSFIAGVSDQITDVSLRNLCQQCVNHYKSDINVLSRFIENPNIQ